MLTAAAHFAGLLPPAFRPLFEGTTEIDLAAAFEADRAIRIENGKVTTGALTFNASGTLNTLGDNDLKASLAGTNGVIDFRLPLEDGEARFAIRNADLSLTGAAGSAVLDVNADIERATLPQGEIEAIRLTANGERFNLATRTGPVRLALDAGATRFTNPDIDRLVKGPARIEGVLALTPETVRFDPVKIDSARLSGTVTGDYTIAENTVALGFSLTASPLGLPPAAAARIDAPVILAGNLATGAAGTVNLTDVTVKTGTLEAAGNAAIEIGNVTATLAGTLPDIGGFLADAKGAAGFKADISGPLDALAVKAQVTSQSAALAGRTLNDLALNADATLGQSGPKAAITATASFEGQVVDATADIVSNEGRIRLPALGLRIGENNITGALDLTADLKPNGLLRFDLPDLGPLAAMAGQTVSGDLTGTAAIDSADGKTSVAVKANGKTITRGELSIANPVVDLTVADLTTLAVQGSVSAGMVAQGANRLNAVKLDLDRNSDRTAFGLNASYDDAPLRLSGDIPEGSAGRTQINLTSFTAAPRQIPLALSAPTTIAVENGAVVLRQLVITALGGTVTVDGTVGQRLDLTARLANVDDEIPVGDGSAQLAIPSATLSLRGDLNAAVIDLTADIRDAAVPQGQFNAVTLRAHSDAFDLAARTGTVSTNLAAGTTRFADANLDRLIKGPVKLDAMLAASLGTLSASTR